MEKNIYKNVQLTRRNYKGKLHNSLIGLLWKKFGKKYLKDLRIKNISKVYEYMDNELIQYIDVTDNMQMEYLKNKTSPDFIKLCNPEWNENITEEGFIHALKLADEFWELYIKHAVAEMEAIELIIRKTNETNENKI